MSLAPIISLLLILGSANLVDPAFPPMAISGGTVVAQLRLADGIVEAVDILSGEEPFASSCKTALAQWQLPSEKNGDAIVVVHFRHPDLFDYANSEEKIRFVEPKGSLPYPKRIVGPPYSPQMMAQGCVILKTAISAKGSVLDIQVLKTLGALTDSGVDAVKKWEFIPAEDSRGMGTISNAYVVLVFRFPVIAPKE
jgi:hypothetical protein